MNTHVRTRYTSENTFALIVDVQQRLMTAMHEGGALSRALTRFVRGLRLLEVPAIYTEQYPQGLGGTIGALSVELEGLPRGEKREFSCMRNSDVAALLPGTHENRTLLVAGIETHVCVQQTVVDALREGYAVTVIADAVSSRSARDRDTALRHMAAEGARISTAEAVLFEICEVSGTSRFKALSRILR
ncbi:MAG: isochorismatase family protein [Spirochaetia bacterium]